MGKLWEKILLIAVSLNNYIKSERDTYNLYFDYGHHIRITEVAIHLKHMRN